MWKPHKSASMSWQHHQMVLSTSNDVAETWECFSAASSSAPGSIITPYAATRPLLHQRHRKCQNTWVVFDHHVYLAFKAPQPPRNTWNEQRPPQTPAHCRNPTQKHKNIAGIARIRFGGSWRRWRRSGAIMRPSPGSSIGLSGKFQVHREGGSGRNAGAACVFWAQRQQLYYM
jgi:hypothetical protein